MDLSPCTRCHLAQLVKSSHMLHILEEDRQRTQLQSSVLPHDNCDARCHLRCNRLTTGQSRHARSLNKETHWYCSQHRNGKAKVIIPIQVTPTPTLIPLHPKENKIIQTRYAASDYHCYIPSCDKVCHLTRTCSGFIEPPDRVLATGEWKYQQNSELRTKKRQLIN